MATQDYQEHQQGTNHSTDYFHLCKPKLSSLSTTPSAVVTLDQRLILKFWCAFAHSPKMQTAIRQRHSSCCRRNVQTLTCLRAPSGAKPQHYSISCCMIGSEIDPEILARSCTSAAVSECRQRTTPQLSALFEGDTLASNPQMNSPYTL